MPAIEALGTFAIATMVVSYALEKKAPVYTAIFSVGCFLAAFYALLIGSYPFSIAEGLWGFIALRRWREANR